MGACKASCREEGNFQPQTRVHYLHRSAGSTVIKRIKSILGTNKNLRPKTCIWVLNKWRECKKNNIFRSGILKPEYVRNNEENISTVKNITLFPGTRSHIGKGSRKGLQKFLRLWSQDCQVNSAVTDCGQNHLETLRPFVHTETGVS